MSYITKNFSVLFLISLIFLGCKSYLPFKKVKDKKETALRVKNELKLVDDEYKVLKRHDSLLYEISNSLNASVSHSLVERRIDSFLSGNYSKLELMLVLKIDRISNDWQFEFDRNEESKTFVNLKNIKDLEIFLKKVEESLSKQNKVKIEVDSTTFRKQ
ncbi:hypothetical protein [Winogradskyella sp.]|uniref:hypothetical protein n=1 Tax=Winogradskyella sp. TaxID=1883156 RepID=UPI00351297B3